MKNNTRNVSKFSPSRPKHSKRVWFVTAALLLVVIAGSLLTYRYFHNRNKSASPESNTTNQINYNPPTEEEKKQTEDQKKQITDNKPTPSTTDSSGKRVVKPIIASANTSSVNAYVTGIFEEGGTCTATFTHGSDKITTTSSGFQNSNYTSCAPLTLQSPLNIKGDWSVVVSYSSSQSAGSSDVTTVKVN